MIHLGLTTFGNKRINVELKFTPREKSILLLFFENGADVSDEKIAEQLGLKITSCRIRIVGIRRKLTEAGYNVKSRYNLIRWAIEHKNEVMAG